MKTTKNLILSLALSVITITTQAQCATLTGVNVTQNQGSVSAFAITTSSYSANRVLSWSSLGGTQTSQNVFNYSTNGSYTICASLSDTTFACPVSNYCTVVLVNTVNTATSTQGNCNAAFAFTLVAGSAYPNTFTVQNFSSGTNLSYFWNFGDGSTSNQLAPIYTYSVSGNHNVCLTVSNGTGCSNTYCDSLYNNSGPINTPTVTPCNASFSVKEDSNHVNVYHAGNYSTGNNLTYLWSFGDGSTSTLASPSHTYATAANYNVCLTVTNGTVCSITNCDSLYANSGPVVTPSVTPNPYCNASFNIFADSMNTGGYFAFNTSTGNNLTYLWNFGDGTTSTLAYPTHSYSLAGQYIVCLTVSSGTNCTSSTCDSSSVQRVASGFLMSSFNVLRPTSVKELAETIRLNTYPNPMTDELAIEVSTNDNKTVKYILIDALGRVVLSGMIDSKKEIVSTSQLKQGFYNLSITNEKGETLKSVKLIK